MDQERSISGAASELAEGHCVALVFIHPERNEGRILRGRIERRDEIFEFLHRPL